MNDGRKGCGRIDKHLAHHWYGPKRYEPTLGRWIKSLYFCTGHVVIEGGSRVH